jgi:type IV secretion system protein VirD4
MDGGKCILQLRGVRPFFSDKYDITRHKMYHSLSDEHPKKAFDIGEYVKKRKDMHFEPKARDKITRFDTHGSAVEEVTKSDTNDDRDKNVGGTVSEEAVNRAKVCTRETAETADNFTLF